MPNRVLILTNEAVDAKILKDALSRAADGPFEITWEKDLAAGLERMHEGTVDALLVDLTLPDSSGLATFDRLHSAAPWVPIMTIAPLEDDALAREAVAHGSQRYLSKGSLANSLVPQALHSMIQRKALEESLHREKSRIHTVLASIGDAVICTDKSGRVEYLNPAGESLTGWTDEESKGRPITEVLPLVNKVTRRVEPNPIEAALAKDRVMPLPAGTILVRRDGSELLIEDSAAPIRDQAGTTTGAVMVFHDVTATQAMNEKLTHQAQHDTLTDLPNRALLDDRIAQAIARAKRHGGPVRGALSRPRPVQKRQRLPRARVRRQAAAIRLPASADLRPRVRHGQPAGWRRVRPAVGRAERGGGGGFDSREDPGRADVAALDRRARADHHHQHRYQPLSRGRRQSGGADQECGYRDVSRQGEGPEQLSILQG
ncbi:PAS domain S-box protein [Rhodospirillaceae bacterium R-7]|uniref:PAS domain S-box protein n=1 Tax=Dongia sedimenti TaxID=3064282 RepID=A0ABU0YMT3_9PROT|nr:PAS domain S-box protein [Rhodospirillaceae bacterium R-7]